MKQCKHSPWGPIQYQDTIAPGIISVGTAGHGGLKVSPTLNKTIPDYLRNDDGWYEEDCDWARVFVALESHILLAEEEYSVNTILNGGHKKTLCNWQPDAFERFYGVPIEPGQSYVRDQQQFAKDHENDYVTVSAITDKNNPGMVIVTACIGGRDPHNGQYRGETSNFHVTSEDYKTRGVHGFVIDPSKHPILTH